MAVLVPDIATTSRALTQAFRRAGVESVRTPWECGRAEPFVVTDPMHLVRACLRLGVAHVRFAQFPGFDKTCRRWWRHRFQALQHDPELCRLPGWSPLVSVVESRRRLLSLHSTVGFASVIVTFDVHGRTRRATFLDAQASGAFDHMLSRMFEVPAAEDLLRVEDGQALDLSLLGREQGAAALVAFLGRAGLPRAELERRPDYWLEAGTNVLAYFAGRSGRDHGFIAARQRAKEILTGTR